MPNAESPIVITVFGSSRPQPGSDAYETARALGAALALSVLGTLYLGILPGWFLSKTMAAIPLP